MVQGSRAEGYKVRRAWMSEQAGSTCRGEAAWSHTGAMGRPRDGEGPTRGCGGEGQVQARSRGNGRDVRVITVICGGSARVVGGRDRKGLARKNRVVGTRADAKWSM